MLKMKDLTQNIFFAIYSLDKTWFDAVKIEK